ncbi:MAG: hypothetical protein V4709_09550 [Pseudomonadota bacterium]
MAAPAIKATQRSTFKLRPKARQIAEQRAKLKSISFGDAISELLEEAEANRPQTRIEYRNGLPVMVGPPGAPIVTCEMVKEILDNEW